MTSTPTATKASVEAVINSFVLRFLETTFEPPKFGRGGTWGGSPPSSIRTVLPAACESGTGAERGLIAGSRQIVEQDEPIRTRLVPDVRKPPVSIEMTLLQRALAISH